MTNRKNPFPYRLPLIVLALALLLTPTPTRAQPPAPAAAEPATARPNPPRSPRSLQEVADEIVWNPRQQGVLLLIAPAETAVPTQRYNARRQPDGTYASPVLTLPARTSEGLRLNQLETYFERQIVPCGDVTVLAPATMMVLNTRNLPKPSPTAGFKPVDSFRLLQASLSDAQWRRLASPQGIGYSDLTDTDQRQLFLASLPAQMSLQKIVDNRPQIIPLSESQRRGIRMHMARQLGWMFALEGGARMSINWSDDQPHFSVLDTQGMDWTTRQRQAFGTDLANVVPARAKPGDLPFTWDALSVAIPLNDLKTLGDLVDRIRDTTQVEVFADVRYARLPLTLRGDQAQAGNLLKALARGVTGTYRKVGPAYVLTDDLTGLATRHALLQDWISANTRLAADTDRKVAKALINAKPDRFMEYDPNDPLKPSDTLLKRYTDYQASLRQPRKADDPPPDHDKRFPTADLPPRAQEIIRGQIANFQKSSLPSWGRNINGESVSLSMSTTLKWEIPGVGETSAPYNGEIDNIVDTPRTAPSPSPKTPPRPLPQTLKTRALIVRLGKPDALDSVVRAAKHAGFTELWLDPGPDFKAESAALGQAVQSAHQAHLLARVLIRGGRQKPAKGQDHTSLDTNVRGETYTEYLSRILASGNLPPYPWGYQNDPDTTNPMEAVLRREQDQGDWLDLASAEWPQALQASVRAASETPGVAGIVVSDLVPPGYNPLDPYNNAGGHQAGAQSGYTEANRLDFLRRFHVDPLDLSLNGANGFNSFSLRFRENTYLQLTLPFFPDDTTLTTGGGNAREAGAGTALQEWNRFRSTLAETSLTRLQKQFAGSAVPVWFYQNPSDAIATFGLPCVVESRDKAPEETEKPASAPSPNQTPYPYQPSADQRARSHSLLAAFDAVAFSSSFPLTSLQDGFALMTDYLFDPLNAPLKNWDGLALDLTAETLPAVTGLLSILPPPLAVSTLPSDPPPRRTPAPHQ